MLGLSCLSASTYIFNQQQQDQNQALAQRYIQTIKQRNLVIDIGSSKNAAKPICEECGLGCYSVLVANGIKGN
jgi:hypothetical protein